MGLCYDFRFNPVVCKRMVADNLPTQSSASDPWNAPLSSAASNYLNKKETKEDAQAFQKSSSVENPWTERANNQPQEPYHLKGVGVMDINPTPPWKQPLKTFSVDETLLTYARPEGYPPLPELQLRQVPGYLLRLKWTHVPANVAYWYSLRYRAGYDKAGRLGGGRGTSWPFVHYVAGVALIGFWYHSMGMYLLFRFIRLTTAPTHFSN